MIAVGALAAFVAQPAGKPRGGVVVIPEIFGVNSNDEEWQAKIDQDCKSTGLGSLIFGLFAEMCIEAIKLPDNVIYTKGFNEVLVVVAVIFMALTVLLLIRHVIILIPKFVR